MQDQLSKLWISTSHSSQLDCFQMKPPKSLRWHPAKWKSPSWSTSIANPNMSEWWPHSKARARPRDHVWRLINALGCNSTNLMRFSSLCPTSRAIRHGPAPHHRLKSAAGLVDEVDFKMFKAQNFWMSWLFTNPDMRDRGIAVNNHGGCRKFWAPQALPDSKVSLIKPLPRRKQIRF